MRLDAARDINLIASQDTQQTSGKNSSSGGSIGVGLGVGSGGAGISISANANSSKGHEKGNGVWQNETTVDGGNQLTINSGRDTTLAGAQVSGEAVVADIGRDLTIASTQDSDHYDSKQHSVSGGLGYTFGAGGFSGSISASRDKLSSDYDSVQEQSGIFAGKGGFDVTVGNHTQLDGGVIASTAEAGRNRLDTGTLGFSDIHNRAEFETEHQGAGLSSGGSIGSQFAGNMANGLLVGANRDGHDSSTTHAAVSDGTLIVRDQDRQVQDVNQLSRDVEHANQTLSPIFDKEKEQERLQQAQLIGEIGNQVADIARTEGNIRATNAANEKLNSANAQDLQDAKAAWEKANPGKTATLNDISGQIYKTAYDDAMRASGFGTGGQYQQAIQAATAAVQGLAGSDLSAAIAGGAAPYVAEVIGHYSDLNDAGKVAAHAVVNAALAAAQNQNALAGAAGAATGELVGMIAKEMYGKPANELDETQKQTVSALATLAAGLSGGLAGDSSASAVAGAQAGKTTVENNSMGDIAAALSQGKTTEQVAEEHVKAENERYKRENCGGMSAEACSVKMYTERRESLKQMALYGVDFVPVVGDIKSFAEANSALDYLAAAIGVIPGAGDVAGKAIKGAEKALKAGDLEAASTLINKASSEIQSVRALDVGSYDELKVRAVVGDGLEHDHIPSFAALRKAKENELGRKLTPAEEKTLYKNATAVEVPKDVHRAGPTYGGKNNAAQVEQDALDLCGAVCRDTDALRSNMVERGYEPKQVDEAIEKIIDRNRRTGVIK